MKAQLEKITSSGYNEKTILIISNVEHDDQKLFFLPKLIHINIIQSPGIISISLGDNFSADIFNTWLDNLCSNFNCWLESQKIEYFNTEFKKLIALGKKRRTFTLSKAMGLYAELLHLNALIEEIGPQSALSAWNNPSPAIHDYDFLTCSHEIKAVARSKNEIKISSIDQLSLLDGKELYLIVYVLNVTQQSEKDSLGDLYNNISSKLLSILENVFQQKCAESRFAEYLGPEIEPMNYKFSLIKTDRYMVDQITFPRLHRDNIHRSISSVNYTLNLGSISNFLIDTDV